MSIPLVKVDCDKCGTEYEATVREIGGVPQGWLPKGWKLHDTQDGVGPEPEKVFMLCDGCEEKFRLTIREFKS